MSKINPALGALGAVAVLAGISTASSRQRGGSNRRYYRHYIKEHGESPYRVRIVPFPDGNGRVELVEIPDRPNQWELTLHIYDPRNGFFNESDMINAVRELLEGDDVDMVYANTKDQHLERLNQSDRRFAALSSLMEHLGFRPQGMKFHKESDGVWWSPESAAKHHEGRLEDPKTRDQYITAIKYHAKLVNEPLSCDQEKKLQGLSQQELQNVLSAYLLGIHKEHWDRREGDRMVSQESKWLDRVGRRRR